MVIIDFQYLCYFYLFIYLANRGSSAAACLAKYWEGTM